MNMNGSVLRQATPSRRMPKFKHPPIKPLGWFVILGLVAGLAYELWQYPIPVTGGLVLLTGGGFILGHYEKRRLRQLAESRPDESLCTFARAFDCRQVDTWVIRAVYEELGCVLSHADFPLRPADDLSVTLKIDDGDLDTEIAYAIAQRTGRSLENPESNPFYGKVRSVHDLIMFFNAQPLITRPEP